MKCDKIEFDSKKDGYKYLFKWKMKKGVADVVNFDNIAVLECRRCGKFHLSMKGARK